MLSFSAHQRYFLYGSTVDMRKGFNGLAGLVRQHIGHDLLSGDMFIFINRSRDRIKLLMWDKTGFALYYKQLERCALLDPLHQAQKSQVLQTDYLHSMRWNDNGAMRR